jgi:hypothetical protein
MDATGIWLHNVNVDRTLARLGTYVDPSERAALLKFLIEEEEQLGTGPEQSELIARRVREGKVRISRVLAIIEGLIERDLMNKEMYSKAIAVLTALRQSQVLLEQLYRRRCSHE